MWIYEKKLQYPVKIKNPNPQMAQIIISQLGGPDGEIGASLRYLNQRYSMPDDRIVGILTDVGIEDKNCAFQKNLQTVKKPMRKFSKNRPLLQIVYKIRQQKTRGKKPLVNRYRWICSPFYIPCIRWHDGQHQSD